MKIETLPEKLDLSCQLIYQKTTGYHKSKGNKLKRS